MRKTYILLDELPEAAVDMNRRRKDAIFCRERFARMNGVRDEKAVEVKVSGLSAMTSGNATYVIVMT